jgi:glycine cleavage system regulatory protein
MYGATCLVLENIALDGSTYSQRGDAAFSFKLLMSFDFALILHIMKDVMGITDMLCQALQQKSQDILNAMHLVTTTKTLIQKLRDDGWKTLLKEVTSFCKHQDIEVPDMDACFSSVGRSRRKQKSVTVEHHYRVDIFTAIIDQQLQELNNRFNEQAIELLQLSTALDLRNSYKLFNAEDICLLVDKFYPQDFSDQEKIHLRLQLQHYELDVPNHPKLKNMSLIADLCQGLVETGKSTIYPLIDRLIRLILTLPVSTATIERAFSAMKIVKTRLRNRMEDDFLTNYLIIYIEKEIAERFTIDMIIDDFYSMKERRAQLK